MFDRVMRLCRYLNGDLRLSEERLMSTAIQRRRPASIAIYDVILRQAFLTAIMTDLDARFILVVLMRFNIEGVEEDLHVDATSGGLPRQHNDENDCSLQEHTTEYDVESSGYTTSPDVPAVAARQEDSMGTHNP